MTALFVAAEDDDGGRAGVGVVEKMVGAGEVVGAGAEVSAEERGGPGWGGWLGHDVASFLCEYCSIDGWLRVEQGKQQIPPLRCGMTNKRTSNSKDKNKGDNNSRFLRGAAE